MSDILRGFEILTGFFYLLFGIDGFFKKLPIPQPSPPAKDFLLALEKSRFVLPVVKLIEILAGLGFIFSFQGPLVWCLLSPVVFCILAYHLVLNRREWLMPCILLAMHLLLFFKYFWVLKGIWVS